ncbi:hypothetical protein ACHAXT_013332 [Thalassiosira profunda]
MMLSHLARSARILASSAPCWGGAAGRSALVHRPPIAATACTIGQQSRRHFAKKIVDVRRSAQRSAWSSYLSGNLSDSSLFAELDLNKSGTITVEEINYFLDSVHKEGVAESKFALLQELGGDHEMDRDEFRRWLRLATDVKRGINVATDATKGEESSSSSDSDDESAKGGSSAAPKKKMVDARHGLQRTIWEHFLATGRGASDLFKMIDLNRSSTISSKEISYFMESIGNKGVAQGKLNELAALGDDHELDEEEFYRWLGEATGVELADDGEVERSSVRDDGEGCTPGQW